MSDLNLAWATRSEWVQTTNPLYLALPFKPEIWTDQGTRAVEAEDVSDTLLRFLCDLNSKFSPNKPLTVIVIFHSPPAFEVYLEVPSGIDRRAFAKAARAAWLRTPWGVGTVRVAESADRWNTWKELFLFAPEGVTIPGLWTAPSPRTEPIAA